MSITNRVTDSWKSNSRYKSTDERIKPQLKSLTLEQQMEDNVGQSLSKCPKQQNTWKGDKKEKPQIIKISREKNKPRQQLMEEKKVEMIQTQTDEEQKNQESQKSEQSQQVVKKSNESSIRKSHFMQSTKSSERKTKLTQETESVTIKKREYGTPPPPKIAKNHPKKVQGSNQNLVFKFQELNDQFSQDRKKKQGSYDQLDELERLLSQQEEALQNQITEIDQKIDTIKSDHHSQNNIQASIIMEKRLQEQEKELDNLKHEIKEVKVSHLDDQQKQERDQSHFKNTISELSRRLGIKQQESEDLRQQITQLESQLKYVLIQYIQLLIQFQGLVQQISPKSTQASTIFQIPKSENVEQILQSSNIEQHLRLTKKYESKFTQTEKIQIRNQFTETTPQIQSQPNFQLKQEPAEKKIQTRNQFTETMPQTQFPPNVQPKYEPAERKIQTRNQFTETMPQIQFQPSLPPKQEPAKRKISDNLFGDLTIQIAEVQKPSSCKNILKTSSEINCLQQKDSLEIILLRKQLEESQTKNKKLLSINQDLHQQVKFMAKENDNDLIKNKLTLLTTENYQLKLEIANIKGRTSSRQSEDSQTEQISVIQHKYEELQVFLQEKEEENSKILNKFQELQTINNNLQNNLQMTNSQIKFLTNQINNLKEQISTKRNSGDDSPSLNNGNDAVFTIAELESKCALYEDQIQILEQKVINEERGINFLSQFILEKLIISQELTKVKPQKAQLENQIKIIKDQNYALEMELIRSKEVMAECMNDAFENNEMSFVELMQSRIEK